jgi:hypothetical protein
VVHYLPAAAGKQCHVPLLDDDENEDDDDIDNDSRGDDNSNNVILTVMVLTVREMLVMTMVTKR